MTTALDKVPQLALDAIAKYGIDATFTVKTKLYDDADQSVTETTQTYVRKVTPPEESKTWRDGEVLRESKASVTLAAKDLPFTPVVGMKVQIAGTAYSITKAVAVRTNTAVAIWELRLD